MLQSVNQSAHTPCPFAIGTIILQLGIETVKVMLASVVMLAKLLVVVYLCRGEDGSSNRPVLKELSRQGYHIGTNHQSIGRLPRLRVTDLRLECQRLLAYGNVYYQRVTIHPCFHLISFHRRLFAYAIMLNHRTYLIPASFPVRKAIHTLQCVGQFTDYGQFLWRRELLLCITATSILLVINSGLTHGCRRKTNHE